MIETRLLYYFLAVAREQNITRASELLHITQSTLSRQMMDLEEQLGKQLFIRGKRRLTLTEEGNFLRSKAQEILELLDNTETALRSDEDILSGDICIGCGETYVMEMIAELFAQFHAQYPHVRFHTHSGDADTVLERLDKGLVDMGLLLGPIRQEKYDYLNLHLKDTFGPVSYTHLFFIAVKCIDPVHFLISQVKSKERNIFCNMLRIAGTRDNDHTFLQIPAEDHLGRRYTMCLSDG